MAKHLKPHPWKGMPFGAKARPRPRAMKPTPPPELFVEIVESAGAKVIERLGPYRSESEAEKADRGVNINLNHDRFFTRMAA